MPSPEVILVNRVRARAAHAETALREAVELLRAPAAAPGYSGPDIEVVSRLVEVVGEIRAQAVNWGMPRSSATPADRVPAARCATLAK